MWNTTTQTQVIIVMADGAIRLDDVVFVSLLDDGQLRVIFRHGSEVFLKNGREVFAFMREAWVKAAGPASGVK